MRRIAHEQRFTAQEIAKMFEKTHEVDLHPTNVGQIAKRLGLDYLEESVLIDGFYRNRRRKYGIGDLPVIFAELEKIKNRRALFNRHDGESPIFS